MAQTRSHRRARAQQRLAALAAPLLLGGSLGIASAALAHDRLGAAPRTSGTARPTSEDFVVIRRLVRRYPAPGSERLRFFVQDDRGRQRTLRVVPSPIVTAGKEDALAWFARQFGRPEGLACEEVYGQWIQHEIVDYRR